MPFRDSNIGRGYTLAYDFVSKRVELIEKGTPSINASRLAFQVTVQEEGLLELGMHPILSSIGAGLAAIVNPRLFFRNYRLNH